MIKLNLHKQFDEVKPMRVPLLLQTIFIKSRAAIDKRLHRLVLEVSEVLSIHKKLSIAGLGRALKRPAKVKHNIKAVDRLFGNMKLAQKSIMFYQDCAHYLIGHAKRPLIIVDWSGLTPCGAFHFLRAAVPVGGRALPLLDMAFALDDYQSQKSHEIFIQKLKSLLPKECCPILITDAGFRCPWYQLVRKMGWDFVGRVRNITQYQDKNSGKWIPIKMLYMQASAHARYLFETRLAKANPVVCHFNIIKQKKKYRVKKNLAGKKVQCSVSKKHEKGANEPWLLATSLAPSDFSSHQITNLYKKRMQIEEGIRDLKNPRNGFSLRECRSYTVDRLNVALLLAAIGMLLLWLLGIVAKNRRLHYSYQANTVKSRNVLSHFMLGWQILTRDHRSIAYQDCIHALKQLKTSLEFQVL
jgi:hypothetical protein